MRRACDNPFAVHRVLGERYRLDDEGWARLLERLERSGWRGAIVGPHGSGKTTLLEDLGARLERAGHRVRFIRLNSSERRLSPLPDAQQLAPEVVLCDGAEQLGVVDWRRLRSRARALVITTHRDGMLPLLHRCATSASLLRELVHALGQEVSIAESETLHRRWRGNVREALRELYDDWASDQYAGHWPCSETVTGRHTVHA